MLRHLAHQWRKHQGFLRRFHHHKMQSSDYRRFNIEGITGGDDYAAMRQVLTRRYKPVADAQREAGGAELTGKQPHLPDLVLVDGGKGQVSMAREVFAELGLDLSRIVGVEKGEGRKVGLEELVFADGRESLSGPRLRGADVGGPDSRRSPPLCHHRHARSPRQGAHGQQQPGGNSRSGPQKRARLLQRFGGVRGVQEASVDDLMTVDGISATLADEIYRALH